MSKEYKSFNDDSLHLDSASPFFYDHISRYWYAHDLSDGKSVLDCACGKGYGSYIISKNAASVTGVDLNEGSLAKARETFNKENLNFVKQDVFKLEELDQKFDMIAAFEIIEHIDGSRTDEFLKSLKGALKEDGVLLISTPNHDVTTKSKVSVPSFHINNLKSTELRQMLNEHFSKVEMLGQYKRRSALYNAVFSLDFFNLRHVIRNIGKTSPPVKDMEGHEDHDEDQNQLVAKDFDIRPKVLDQYEFSPRHWRQAGLSFAICSK